MRTFRMLFCAWKMTSEGPQNQQEEHLILHSISGPVHCSVCSCTVCHQCESCTPLLNTSLFFLPTQLWASPASLPLSSLLTLVQEGSKCPGCHLQLDLHLFLSMMPTISTVNGAMECPHSLLIQRSSRGTGEFQDSLSRCLQVQEVQIIPVYLCLLSDIFSCSIRQPRNALLFAHSFRQGRNSLLNTVALILQCLHGNWY